MIALTPDTHVDEACAHLREFAQKVGRVPLCWLWGPDVREAWSEWLDSAEASAMLVNDPWNELPDDGRICDWGGLPAYPMVCEGVALRTAAELEEAA